MVGQVLRYLNDYFIRYYCGVRQYSYTKDATFSSDTISATSFDDTFLAGEYIKIYGSRLNDGVYKITEANTDNIVLDATLTTEEEISVELTKCFIPIDLLEIIEEIDTYNSNVTDGISSESQGNRSVSYVGSGWKQAFQARLAPFKKVRW